MINYIVKNAVSHIQNITVSIILLVLSYRQIKKYYGISQMKTLQMKQTPPNSKTPKMIGLRIIFPEKTKKQYLLNKSLPKKQWNY